MTGQEQKQEQEVDREVDREVLHALMDLANQEQSGDYEPAEIRLGPFTAYTLIGCLQLAWRYPALSQVQRSCIERIARSMQELFEAPLHESLERGWDVDQDVAVTETEISDCGCRHGIGCEG